MAVTTKKTFPATSNATTTVFSPVGIQLNNQDDLDVYVTLSGGTRVLQLRQATVSTAVGSGVDKHPQVNDTTGLYFPAVTAGTNLINYTLSTDNNTITFNSALPQGAVVFCERRTRDEDGTYTSFASGSTIRAADLNNSSTESNFTAQDGRNKAFTIEGVLFRGDQPSTNFVTSDHIVAGTIVTSDLANDSVTADKIPNDTINSEHYAAGSIDTEHIANENITTAKLAPDAVTSAKLADNAVNSEHYVDGSIDLVHMSADSVDSFQIVDGAVDHVHLAADIIDGDNIQDDVVNSEHIAAGALDNEHYAAGSITSDKLNGTTVVTNSEQAASTPNDTSFFTTAAAEARYFNASTGETIKDGQAFPDNDTSIATTAAINDRILDIVDGVGGFVPLVDEGEIPQYHPEKENNASDRRGTILSIGTLTKTYTPSGGTVTILASDLTHHSVNATIVQCGTTVLPSGFGVLVETKQQTDGQYAAGPSFIFHRLVPKATEVTTVAGKATEIGLLGTTAVVQDLAILGTADVVADLAILGTNDVVADLNTLGTADVVADLNTLGTADVVNDMNILGTSANVTAMDNCSGSIASINNASSNLNSINNFGDTYQVSANNPSTDGGGNALAAGDLYFNTSANELKVYNGSAWQGGVTATGNFAVTTGNTFTGNNIFTAHTTHNDNVKALFGTGSDLEIYHNGSHSYLSNITGNLNLDNSSGGNTTISAGNDIFLKPQGGEAGVYILGDGGVELYYNNSKKLETQSNGVTVTSKAQIEGTSGAQELIFKRTNTAGSNGNSFGSIKFIDQNNNNIGRISTVRSTAVDDGDIRFETRPTGGSLTERLRILSAGNIQIPADSAKLQLGADQDLEIYHTGSSGNIINTTGLLKISASVGSTYVQSNSNVWITKNNASETMAKFSGDGAVELYYDNSKKLETTSTGASVTGQLGIGTLSALEKLDVFNGCVNVGYSGNTSGDKILLKGFGNRSGSSTFGNVSIRSTYNSSTNAGSLDFYTASGGQNTTKRLEITSDGNVQIPADNAKLQIGASQDLKIHHDGTHNFIETGGADIIIYGTGEDLAKFKDDGAVELYHDGSKKFETTSDGITVSGKIMPSANNTHNIGSASLRFVNLFLSNALDFGDGATAQFGDSDDFKIYHDGVNSLTFFDATVGGVRFRTDIGNSARSNIILGAGVDLYYNNSKKFETTATGAKIESTTDATLSISNSQGSGISRLTLANTGTTNCHFSNENSILRIGHTTTENHIRAVYNGTVELNYNNSKKLETTSDGVSISGQLALSSHLDMGDNDIIKLGTGDDFQIYHDGSNSFIRDVGTGVLTLDTNGSKIQLMADGTSSKTLANFIKDGAVELYHDGTQKFRTTSIGTNTTGNAVFNGVTGGNSMQINLPDGNNDSVLINGGANQGRTTFRIQAGNATSGSSTGMRWANSSATDIGQIFIDNASSHFNIMNSVQASDIRFHTSSSENSNGSVHVASITNRGSIQGSGDSYTRPAYAFTNDTDSGMYRRSSNVIGFATAANARYFMSGGAFAPNQDNADDLGGSSNRWDDVRATNGNIQTSDRNEKNTITATDLGLDFINKLSPVSYKWNVSNKNESKVGKRTHYGLIAQDVETILKGIGKTSLDFAGFCYDKPTEDVDGNTIENPREYYGLRYNEFMAPMIKAIQELSTEINTLKTKVAALEAA